MTLKIDDQMAIEEIKQTAKGLGLDIIGGKVRRTSSRFCLGVEHGDYNGTELFGVGTDRFIWMAYKPNGSNKIRIYSRNYPDDGIVEFTLGQVPGPRSPEIADTWARFPYGVSYILKKEGYDLHTGFDAVISGNIPGGGMSRSASLTINLFLTLLEVNNVPVEDDFRIIDMAQAVENEYIGSPCGQLDQIMVYFARENMGTHYNPKTRTIRYIPLGEKAIDFRIVVMDTGTDRPGLEKSTYKIRREECEEFSRILQQSGYGVSCLADVTEQELFDKIRSRFSAEHPNLFARLDYIFHAQQRFYRMLQAWKDGDVETVGGIFRKDGIGLRDDYQISGPELETMCDIARSVPDVLGERMLGGGDKGAAGAMVKAKAVTELEKAITTGYPRSRPEQKDKFAVHVCRVVDGVKVFDQV